MIISNIIVYSVVLGGILLKAKCDDCYKKIIF